MSLEFRVLGPLEVVRNGASVPLGPRRQRAVLARLLLDPGHPVSTHRLVEDVWGGAPPDGAVRTVRSYLSRLRATLGGDVIATRRPGYVLNADVEAIDSLVFSRLAVEGHELLRRQNPRAAAGRLRDALSRWRGVPLEDLPPEPFVLAEARRLEELRLVAVEDRMEAELALAANAELVAELETLVAEHPVRERLWGHLMTALYRAGRQAEALEAYRRARAVLNEELGLEPGPELCRLEAAILRHELAPPEAGPRHNLPTPLTALVGRGREVADVLDALTSHRLTTLVGAGGAGKTRVAVEAAQRAVDRFPDGVWWVDLAPLFDPGLVAQTVAVAVGVDDTSARSREAVLVEHLAQTNALLVLDNCEHLAAACPALVERLLSACPGLHVLATSREPLGVPGEIVYDVPPLTPPPQDGDDDPAAYDAVRLFLARSPTQIPPAAMPAVARTCRELDGLPLAIEIAAAQTRLLSPEEIADRLGDRFRLLTYWSRTALPRHRTLRASLDWSYALLDAPEQEFLCRLGVFAGGFSLEAAEAVGDAGGRTLDVLRRLVDASLVVRDERSATTRFRLLETVRQYAVQQGDAAGQAEDAARRHARFFAGLADATLAALDDPDEPMRYAEVDTELGNLRVALAWAHHAEPDLLARLARGLGNYWRLRGYLDEGELWLTRAAAAPDVPAAVRADLLGFLGHLDIRRSEFRRARDRLEQAVGLARSAGTSAQLGRWLHRLAFCRRSQGEFDAARELLEEAIAQSRSAGDHRMASHQLGSLADIALLEGRYDDAERLYDEAWALVQPAPAGHQVAYLDSTARLALARGDLDEGARRSADGLARARELGDSWHIGLNLANLAYVARRRGDAAGAAAALTEALDVLSAMREIPGLADALDVLAGLCLDHEEPATAVTLLAVAQSLRAGVGGHRGWLDRPYVAADRDAARARMTEEQYHSARSHGHSLSVGEAVAFAGACCARIRGSRPRQRVSASSRPEPS